MILVHKIPQNKPRTTIICTEPHKNLYMAIILGANMLYINLCLFKETSMAPKGFNEPHLPKARYVLAVAAREF